MPRTAAAVPVSAHTSERLLGLSPTRTHILSLEPRSVSVGRLLPSSPFTEQEVQQTWSGELTIQLRVACVGIGPMLIAEEDLEMPPAQAPGASLLTGTPWEGLPADPTHSPPTRLLERVLGLPDGFGSIESCLTFF